MEYRKALSNHNDPIISDLHLQIIRQDNQWLLIHPHPDRQQTRNGLLYHGRKIRGDKFYRKPLTRGDVFRIEDEVAWYILARRMKRKHIFNSQTLPRSIIS